jgi:uncharacterized protein YciI
VANFVYRLDPVRPGFVTDPTPEEKAISQRHVAYLRSLHDSGKLLFAMRIREEGGVGMVGVRAETLDEVRGLMEADPQYAEGAMRGSVHPIGMAEFAKT